MLKTDAVESLAEQVAFGGVEVEDLIVIAVVEFEAVTTASCRGAAAPTVRKSWTFLMRSVISAGAIV